ncbi:MAG TPA: TIGR02757 family protein [Candidatus Tidjanibacter faecipullorum]|uniref:TIGR02757 family protein n=1 Tax=Candidatus Tidjanibacter faecipullorum TaxID=2838766 RepID=A0A9D2IMD9_9BACT|nr:TIGR02757 family protein [Candidatus Tidjanibacter faecipullorum]
MRLFAPGGAPHFCVRGRTNLRILRENWHKVTEEEIRDLLDALWLRYEDASFIEDDPISVPHRFTGRHDREVAGFLAATIAWGNRRMIVRNGRRMMELMGDAPYEFVMEASEQALERLDRFVHRTFNGQDLTAFVLALRRMGRTWGGLGNFFETRYEATGDMRCVLADFRREFFACDHPARCEKHVAAIERGASCKRLNMFLRWMVRDSSRGVDFGLWQRIPASALYLPLDLHSGNVARALGLLDRRQNDWRAVEEVTTALRRFDAADPVKYDFALFGAGVNGAMTK